MNDELFGVLQYNSGISGNITSTTQINVDLSSGTEINCEIESENQINVTVESIGAYVKPFHPETHPASMIVEDELRNFVTLQEKNDIQDLIENEKGYIHDQMVSSAYWYIYHGMNKYPAITVVDSSGSVVIGEIVYVSINAVTIEFTSEFSGKAYFN